MKLSALCSIGLALLTLHATAQQPATTAEQAKLKLEEAHAKTGATKARLDALGREAKARAASSKISAKDQTAVEELIKGAESASSDDARQTQITEFLKTASPQVKEMYLSTAAPAPAPAAKAPANDKPAPVVEFSKVPVPAPKVVKAKNAPKKAPQRMVIDSDVLLFNNDSSVAIFRGNVHLRSATMDIDCEELEVVFLKDDGKPGGAPAAAAAVRPKAAPGSTLDPTKPNIPTDEKTPPAAEDEPAGEGEQKIDKAWARGKGSIVTIVKRDPQKGPSVCKCGDAFYDGKTNNLTMKIFPEAEQQGTRIQASDRNTVLVLDQQGKISANGPVKTIRPDTSKKAPAPTAPGTTPATTAPATPTKPANPR